jgi:hypothetical protein
MEKESAVPSWVKQMEEAKQNVKINWVPGSIAGETARFFTRLGCGIAKPAPLTLSSARSVTPVAPVRTEVEKTPTRLVVMNSAPVGKTLSLRNNNNSLGNTEFYQNNTEQKNTKRSKRKSKVNTRRRR